MESHSLAQQQRIPLSPTEMRYKLSRSRPNRARSNNSRIRFSSSQEFNATILFAFAAYIHAGLGDHPHTCSVLLANLVLPAPLLLPRKLGIDLHSYLKCSNALELRVCWLTIPSNIASTGQSFSSIHYPTLVYSLLTQRLRVGYVRLNINVPHSRVLRTLASSFSMLQRTMLALSVSTRGPSYPVHSTFENLLSENPFFASTFSKPFRNAIQHSCLKHIIH